MNRKRDFTEVSLDKNLTCIPKKFKIHQKNYLYELSDDLIMYIFKTHMENHIKQFGIKVNYSKSLLISSYIMRMSAISKHVSKIIKCNIQTFFKPEDYFFCNYNFAQVITKDEYFKVDSKNLISSYTNGYIVIKNETFVGNIPVSQYVRYLNGEPEEILENPLFMRSTLTTNEYEEAKIKYTEWKQNNPSEFVPYFKRIDFVNCKFINSNLYNNNEQELSIYFLNCEFKCISTEFDKEHFSFFRTNIVMKSCKIIDAMFHINNSVNILMMDNIFLYQEESCVREHSFIQIEGLESQAIVKNNCFYIQNIEKNTTTSVSDETLLKFKDSKNEVEIIFTNNYIHKSFEYEVKRYFYPDTLLGFGIDKLKKLEFHNNIYLETLNKKNSRRPILFDSNSQYFNTVTGEHEPWKLSKTPYSDLILDIEVDSTNECYFSEDFPDGIRLTEKNFLIELISKCKDLKNYKHFQIKISQNQYNENEIKSQFKKEEVIEQYDKNDKNNKQQFSNTNSNLEYVTWF